MRAEGMNMRLGGAGRLQQHDHQRVGGGSVGADKTIAVVNGRKEGEGGQATGGCTRDR